MKGPKRPTHAEACRQQTVEMSRSYRQCHRQLPKASTEEDVALRLAEKMLRKLRCGAPTRAGHPCNRRALAHGRCASHREKS